MLQRPSRDVKYFIYFFLFKTHCLYSHKNAILFIRIIHTHTHTERWRRVVLGPRPVEKRYLFIFFIILFWRFRVHTRAYILYYDNNNKCATTTAIITVIIWKLLYSYPYTLLRRYNAVNMSSVCGVIKHTVHGWMWKQHNVWLAVRDEPFALGV